MDDEEQTQGLSGWAGFALGKMFADHQRSTDQTARWFGRTLGGTGQTTVMDERAQLLHQNQLLSAENARLRRQLADYEYNYKELKDWAEGVRRPQVVP